MTVLKYLGYVLFFLVAFILGLYFTFPWNAAKDRLLDMASKGSGMNITADELSPSWITGFKAKNVKITPAGSKEPIVLEEVTARAKVFALLSGKQGGEVSLPIAKGTVDADVLVSEETMVVRSNTEGVELALIPGLIDATGLPLSGTLDLNADLVIGQKDPKLTNGNIELKVKGLRVEKGGKLSGFPVPELAIGDADWKIPVEAGKATLKNLRVAGESVELILDGTINVLQPISRSTGNLTVSFKPSEKFLASDPILAALLNNIARAKGGDGFYTYAMSGALKSPRFTPRKK